MDRVIDKEFNDIPFSESSVTLELSLIQRRCQELLDDPDETAQLSLEDPDPIAIEGVNPYESG